MELNNVKELLTKTGDLRLLTRENGEVRITDLFLNGDGELRLEQYSTISMNELQTIAKENAKANNEFVAGKAYPIDSDIVDSLLGSVKLWLLFEEGVDEDLTQILEILENHDLDKLVKLDFNTTVVEFMQSDVEEMLYIGA